MRRTRAALVPSLALLAGALLPLLSFAVPLPAWVVIPALAVALVVLLPLRPVPVFSFVGGAAASFVAVMLLWSQSWSCGDVVDGVLVQYDCAQGPPRD